VSVQGNGGVRGGGALSSSTAAADFGWPGGWLVLGAPGIQSVCMGTAASPHRRNDQRPSVNHPARPPTTGAGGGIHEAAFIRIRAPVH
jgi:hypothetical protein